MIYYPLLFNYTNMPEPIRPVRPVEPTMPVREQPPEQPDRTSEEVAEEETGLPFAEVLERAKKRHAESPDPARWDKKR